MRQAFEFWIAWLLLRILGSLPRNIARAVGAGIGWIGYVCLPRLRRVGLRNLELAFPALPRVRRLAILQAEYRNIGWLLAEFCQMARYTPENTQGFLRYEGLHHFLEAERRGRGVLIVTGHLGAWELSSFYHSLMGHPMRMVIRRLDNARVDRLVNRIRCLHGNTVLHKDDFARGLLSAMRQGHSVGILMDTNMTPPQGVFVPFFGVEACTASGLARVALKTGAAVLPGFLLWQASERKYVLTFGQEIAHPESGNAEQDILELTAACTGAIETFIRAYPEQWLWVHRRWKTRPAGQAAIY